MSERKTWECQSPRLKSERMQQTATCVLWGYIVSVGTVPSPIDRIVCQSMPQDSRRSDSHQAYWTWGIGGNVFLLTAVAHMDIRQEWWGRHTVGLGGWPKRGTYLLLKWQTTLNTAYSGSAFRTTCLKGSRCFVTYVYPRARVWRRTRDYPIYGCLIR